MEKKVTYKCPKCKAEYAEHVNVITINAKTGQVYRVPHRPQWCERCGTGLIRKVTLTDLSPSTANTVSTQNLINRGKKP